MKKLLFFLLGFFLVVLGLAMVFQNWAVLAAMVKAMAGVVLAVVGLVVMFSTGLRR